MSRAIGVSSFIADLIVSMSLICVLLGGFFARFDLKWDRKKGDAS
jgi:simple sugar transport system permease protein